MKKILLLSIALFFVSCGHMGKKGKSCHSSHAKQCKVDKKCDSKDSKQCKMHKAKCDSKDGKKCKMHKSKCDSKKHGHKDHSKVSAAECDLDTCKVHRTKKTKM